MAFRVLSYNIFKLGSRVDPAKVIDHVLGLDPQPDIIGFQEVFDTKLMVPGFRGRNTKKLLRTALEPRGYTVRWLAGGRPPSPVLRFLTFGRFKDGILVAARNSTFTFEPEQDHFDRVLRKGPFDRRVMQCALLKEVSTDRRIAFFNTHLSVGPKRDAEKARAKRVEQISLAVEFIEKIDADHSPVASIWTGDFNSLPDQEVSTIRIEHEFVDCWMQRNPAIPEEDGYTRDPSNSIVARSSSPEELGGGRRIDYVFYRPEAALTMTGSEVVLKQTEPTEFPDSSSREENLSDHYGVCADFE